jgi:hypothetical protein
LPPAASSCHSVPEWRSSPRRKPHHCVFQVDDGFFYPGATHNPMQSELPQKPHVLEVEGPSKPAFPNKASMAQFFNSGRL